jgi:excisionase family DNA binding protein
VTDPLHFLTLEECAGLTGLSRELIRAYIESGRIRGVLVGTKGGHDQYKIPRRSLEVWVEEIATSQRTSQRGARRKAAQGGTERLRAVR